MIVIKGTSEVPQLPLSYPINTVVELKKKTEAPPLTK
jgi:hypothetical protein